MLSLQQSAEAYLANIADANHIIHLDGLKKIDGGGTHDVYQSDEHPQLLIKIMRDTLGKDTHLLTQKLNQLTTKYDALYRVFGEDRCILETRSIQKVQSSTGDTPMIGIVSIVPFDSCFKSKTKFGFNVESVELDGVLLTKKRYLYGEANRFFLGNQKMQTGYAINQYPLLNKPFAPIFKLLDKDDDLKIVMREFLTNYKSFYQETDILLDTVGFDNVLFYQDEQNIWQFKLGSVIKHDSGKLAKQMIAEVAKNPALVNDSFECFTSIYFMPACIRALNACAHKLGLDKVIDDITVDEKTSNALATVYLQMKKSDQALNHARHGEFSAALALYQQFIPDGQTDDTRVRDFMGTLYWAYIKTADKEPSRQEIEAYLSLLKDPRNVFPDHRKQAVEEAILGLQEKMQFIANKPSLA